MRHCGVTAFLATVAFASGAQAEPLAPSPAPGLPRWQWTGPSTHAALVRIDLARADVTILPSADNRLVVTIIAQGSVEDAARMWIDVAEKDGGYILSDRFPLRSALALPKECLPPPDERGDFWLVSTKLRVTVAAPSGWLPRVSVSEGSVNDLRQTFR